MPDKFPATIGGCVDALFKLRSERLKLKKKVDEIGAQEGALREHVLKTFGKAKLNGAKGSLASCSVSRKTVANIVDWDKTLKWILKNRAWDFLYHRVNDKAFNERLEAKMVIPKDAMIPFEVAGLSLTRIGGKGKKQSQGEAHGEEN